MFAILTFNAAHSYSNSMPVDSSTYAYDTEQSLGTELTFAQRASTVSHTSAEFSGNPKNIVLYHYL